MTSQNDFALRPGTLLVVTELTASSITIFQIEEDGQPGAVVENESAGSGPFGFAFNSRGHLIEGYSASIVTI